LKNPTTTPSGRISNEPEERKKERKKERGGEKYHL
jgi:hypothetical protein